MAPLLALLSILFGGEAEAAALPPPKSPVAIVEVANAEETETAEDAGALTRVHHTRVIAQPEPVKEQRWLGKVQIPGQVIDFVVTIVDSERGLTGKLDIPVQGLMGGELRTVVREGDELRFDFAIPNQPETVWPRWVVTIDESGKTAKGVLNQSGASFPTTMTLDVTGKAEVLKRPQNPTRPLPYREEVVTISAGEHTLAGTLTLPDRDEFGDGPYPGVVMITGSGPQDRDETLLGHKPFLVLSDRLARRGIAALRYDDRGVGKSTGDFATATSLDFADDARACAELLATRDDIGKIGLIGHSEGGLIAPFVARGNSEIDFVVLLAAPGVPGREVLVRQSHDIGKAAGVTEAVLGQQSELMNKIYDLLLADADETAIRAELEKLVRLQFGVGPDAQDASITETVDQSFQMLIGPWWRQFLTLDPRPALTEMTQPVLALNGSLDLQVPPDQNLSEIERVFDEAGKSDRLTAVEAPGLNHLFQPTETGSLSEYGEIETTFDESVMDRISDWILKNMR